MPNWLLFIDDERFPVDDGQNWKIARNLDETIALIREFGVPVHIAFDHDLGEGQPNGLEITQKMIEMDLDKEIDIPQDMTFYVHSQNPVGRENIHSLLGNYLDFKHG